MTRLAPRYVGRTIGCVVALLLAIPVGAQELDMLELDDFLDPRALRSTTASGGAYRFVASRVYVGAAERSNFRGDFFQSRVHFGRLATSYYTGQWQFSAKLTDYDTRTHREPPYFRSRAQAARYFGIGPRSAPVRAQLSWTFDQSRATGAHNEYALDLTSTIMVSPLRRRITGGIVYAVDPERDTKYAGVSAQLPVVQWKHESSIRIGASLAQDRDRASDVVSRSPNLYKTMVALAIGIPGTESRLYGAYSPTYRRDLHEWNHEVTVMLDASVFSKLFK